MPVSRRSSVSAVPSAGQRLLTDALEGPGLIAIVLIVALVAVVLLAALSRVRRDRTEQPEQVGVLDLPDTADQLRTRAEQALAVLAK